MKVPISQPFHLLCVRAAHVVGLVCSVVVLSFLTSCDPEHRERPYGYIKVGTLQELGAAEQNHDNARVYIRRDAQGYSAMSTLCTKDLTHLKEVPCGSSRCWQSSEVNGNYSIYSWEGKLLSGPAVRNLPYFRLRIEPGKYGGVPDTLYVVVGEEVPAQWRLAVPATAAATQ